MPQTTLHTKTEAIHLQQPEFIRLLFEYVITLFWKEMRRNQWVTGHDWNECRNQAQGRSCRKRCPPRGRTALTVGTRPTGWADPRPDLLWGKRLKEAGPSQACLQGSSCATSRPPGRQELRPDGFAWGAYKNSLCFRWLQLMWGPRGCSQNLSLTIISPGGSTQSPSEIGQWAFSETLPYVIVMFSCQYITSSFHSSVHRSLKKYWIITIKRREKLQKWIEYRLWTREQHFESMHIWASLLSKGLNKPAVSTAQREAGPVLCFGPGLGAVSRIPEGWVFASLTCGHVLQVPACGMSECPQHGGVWVRHGRLRAWTPSEPEAAPLAVDAGHQPQNIIRNGIFWKPDLVRVAAQFPWSHWPPLLLVPRAQTQKLAAN